jgi:WD40 repeat protein
VILSFICSFRSCSFSFPLPFLFFVLCFLVFFFLSASLGKWLYCGSEDKNIYIFDTANGALEETFPVQTTSDITEIVHHPFRNVLAILTRDGKVSFAAP